MWRQGTVAALLAGALLCPPSAIAPRAFAQSPSAAQKPPVAPAAEFPRELVEWAPRSGNPVFTAEGSGHWDVKIRERGWILFDDDTYHLWFTGYDGTHEGIKQLGYATSPDGVRWTRSPKNPLCREHYIEDMMVVHQGDTYYMFSEGPADNHAEMLTSKNRVDWKWEGPLDVRLADGKQPAKKPCGTPTIWIENGKWYLFYEWLDRGVWLATSNDPRSRVWTNEQDESVLSPGPGEYDKEMIAVDQVIKYGGAYFAFYHGSGSGTKMPRTWNTNVARSTDLVHWQKYPRNPIVDDNKSSGIVVPIDGRFRLYTMHDHVDIFEPRAR